MTIPGRAASRGPRAEPSDASASRKLRRTFRRLWRFVALFALLEVAYVAAFEWAARSGRLADWIHCRPEKIVVKFASAHSFFPFRISTTGLEIQGQTPKMRWRLRLDSASGWLSPLALERRAIRFPWVQGAGGSVWIRREAPPNESGFPVTTTSEERLPPLSALSAEPNRAAPVERPKWSVELPLAALEQVREIWWDALRLEGSFDAEGGFSIFAGRELELSPTRIQAADVSAWLSSAAIGTGIAGKAEVGVARYPFHEVRGLAVLDRVSGVADVSGRLAEQALLGLYLERAPWLSFGSGQGDLRAHLAVDAGQLQEGTEVEFAHAGLETRVFDFRATGDARIRFAVSAASSGERPPAAGLELRYDDFVVRAGEDPRPQFVGSGLVLSARSQALELRNVLGTTRLTIDLGRARLPDLAVFGSWIPATSGLRLVSGAGSARGELEADLAANDAHGRFEAEIDAATVQFRDLELSGEVKLTIEIPRADLRKRTFDLAGTRLELAHFRSPQAESAMRASRLSSPGWWAEWTLDQGQVALAPPPAASGRFSMRLRDSVPIVGLFEARRQLPRWVERLLSIDGIEASGRFAWSPSETTLDDLETKVRTASVRARMRFARDLRRGLLMVEWHRLAVGLRLDNEQKQWKFAGVRPWFESADLGGARAGELSDDPLAEPGFSQVEWSAPRSYDGIELPEIGFDFEVVPGSAVRGELDGDADPEAVALVALPSLADPKALRLAAVDLVEGRAEPIAALELPAGAQVRSLAVVAGDAVAEWIVPGGTASGGSSFHKESLRWRPTDGAGRTERLAAGRLELKDLAGRRWQADRSSRERSRAELPAFALSFSEQGVEVDRGCQRFASRATLGEDLVLRFGALTALAGDCAEPASPLGDGAADPSPGSEGVYRLEFRPGQLRLVPVQPLSGLALPSAWLRLVAP